MREEILSAAFEKASVNLTAEQLHWFIRYFEMLVEKNKVMNLTAITEFDEVVVKHFVDSCMLFIDAKPCSDWGKAGFDGVFSSAVMRDQEVPTGKSTLGLSIIDVGTGAGFPGLPLKLLHPEISLTLLDTLRKRVDFLGEVVTELGLQNVTLRHDRAEDAARDPKFREQFDVAVSRAVSRLSVLSEYCLPYVKVGGLFVAYKSGQSAEEIEEAKAAIRLLGGEIETVSEFNVPGTDLSRSLVYIRKIQATPEKYPRKAGKVEKSPLK